MKRVLSVIVTIFVVSSLAGCGGRSAPSGMPKLYPCTITITDKENNPLANVILTTNHPDDPAYAWAAVGTTNESGVADLKTLGEYRGAPAGTFKVTATLYDSRPHPNPVFALDADGNPNFETYNALKPVYASLKDPPLTLEVDSKATSVTFQIEKL